MIWYKDSKDDIMVSTRVRLARNVGKYPFPMMLNEKGEPLVIEINTIPGMTETSLVPDAARHAGMSMEDLTEKMIDLALEKQK